MTGSVTFSNDAVSSLVLVGIVVAGMVIGAIGVCWLIYAIARDRS